MQSRAAYISVVVICGSASNMVAQDPDLTSNRLPIAQDRVERDAAGVPFKSGYCKVTAVQKELQLNREQLQSLECLFNNLITEARAIPKIAPSTVDRERLPLAEEESRHKKINARFEEQVALLTKEAELLQKILEPKQYARLDQIILQKSIPFAFTGDPVATRLGLSSEQRSKIQTRYVDFSKEAGEINGDVSQERLKAAATQDAVRAEWDRAREAGKVPRETRRQLTHEAKRRAIADMIAFLTDEQSDMWKLMVGEPFEFPDKPRQ